MQSELIQSPLYKILNPDSIAIFGASNRFTSMGSSQLASILDLKFRGRLYPIHPKEKTVQGLKAYRSVEDLPEVPDLALIILPTHLVLDTMDRCGRKGIRHAIIISGGFKEKGREGIELEDRLIEISKRYGMRFLGPNCIGIVNPYKELNTTFLPYTAEPGFIGMASQSGSFITQMFDYLAKFNLGFSAGISVGNEANIDVVDCIEYLAHCPNTRAIGLYLETIRRGRRFIEVVQETVKIKPVVAYYVGGTEAGKRASLSHTGALAGPDELYEGIFKQAGIIRAYSIEELFDFCWVLGSMPPMKDNRVVIQTHSGGPGASTADACERAGLKVADLSEETIQKLKGFVPNTGSVQNPVDLTFMKNPAHYLLNIPEILIDDKEIDGMLIYFLLSVRHIKSALEGLKVPKDQISSYVRNFIEDHTNSLKKMINNKKKPIVGFSYRGSEDQFISELQKRGIPVLPGSLRAARAMWALYRYSKIKESMENEKDK